MSRPLKSTAGPAQALSRLDSWSPEGPEAVEALWAGSGGFDHALSLFPAGCVDIVFDDGRLLAVVPGDRAGRIVTMAGADPVGVRLRCGWGAVVLGASLEGCAGSTRPLADFWGADAHRLAAQLRLTATPRARLDRMAEAVEMRIGPRSRPPRSLLDDLEAAGRRSVTPRALHQASVRHVGIGPAVLRRVLRFERLIRRLPDLAAGRLSAAELALETGFSDQAHLIRECRRIAGRTPRMLSAALAR